MEHTRFPRRSALFVTLGEAGSFVAAAKRTGTAASTLSRRIAELEEALGQRLVHRTSRRFALTPDGERVLSRAREHVVALNDLVDADDDEPAGRLRVTAMLATGAELIAPMLMSFAKRYPRVNVELNLTNAVLPIIEEGIDIAFRSAPTTDGDLVARHVTRWPYVLVGAPKLAKRRMTLEALASVPAILTRTNATWEFVHENGSKQSVRPAARFLVNDPRVALEAAAAGLGIVAAPADRIAHYGKRLRAIQISNYELAARELYAVYPSRKLVPARVRLAIDWIIGRMTRASSGP